MDVQPWLLALALVTACGGEVERGSQKPAESTPAAAGASTSAQGQSTDDPAAETDLGDCVPGALENPATDEPCAWVADKRCYQTREMACNCACPRSHDSQCASGFDDGPNGHVWVACN